MEAIKGRFHFYGMKVVWFKSHIVAWERSLFPNHESNDKTWRRRPRLSLRQRYSLLWSKNTDYENTDIFLSGNANVQISRQQANHIMCCQSHTWLCCVLRRNCSDPSHPTFGAKYESPQLFLANILFWIILRRFVSIFFRLLKILKLDFWIGNIIRNVFMEWKMGLAGLRPSGNPWTLVQKGNIIWFHHKILFLMQICTQCLFYLQRYTIIIEYLLSRLYWALWNHCAKCQRHYIPTSTYLRNLIQ